MSRWWRAYDEAVDDPKLLLLSDAQHRAWFNLMCVASANGGKLPDMKVLALKLRMKPPKVMALIAALRAAGLIDEVETGLQPHNWNGRQYKSDVSTERVKRFRKRNVTVSGNAPETETETKRSEPNGSGAHAPPDPKTELFDRGKKVLGRESGGLIAKLLRSFGKEDDPKAIAKARARIEEASTKAKPAEWLGRVMSPKNGEFNLMSGIEGVV